MQTATVHVAADDLQLTGSYEVTGDVLYLSAPATTREQPRRSRPRVMRSGLIMTAASLT